MAEGLKAMALEGHGLAFLPASSVGKEAPKGTAQALWAYLVAHNAPK
jgi:hypothetical protein